MSPKAVRIVTFLYPFIMILVGIGYAKYDDYGIDGDAVAFMDIGDALLQGKFSMVANGYWNPAYAATLALGKIVARPSLWGELQTFYYVNLLIFAGAVAACIYFARSLVLLRDGILKANNQTAALSSFVLTLASLSFVFISFQHELSLGNVHSDSLLLLFFLLTAGFLARLLATGRFRYYLLIGFGLGCAYLTKSFAFPAAAILLIAILIYGLSRKDGARLRIAGGACAAIAVFLILSGPYVAAISMQRERLTTGDSAMINYAFFIDRTERWHEWHNGTLGEAGGTFKHPEQLLIDTPPVYSYAQHLVGSYPLWFDPSYWTDGLHARFSVSGQAHQLLHNPRLLLRFLVGHPEPLLYMFVLLVMGYRFPSPTKVAWPAFSIIGFGAAMLSIYLLIDIQERYITSMFMLILVPPLALLRLSGRNTEVAAVAVTLLLAGIVAADGVRDVAELRRVEEVTGHQGGRYGGQIYTVAHALADLGIAHGSLLACMGENACYVNEYWPRLLSSQIAAEVDVPPLQDPAAFWDAQLNKNEILDVLRGQNVRALVSEFPNGISAGEGWHRLGISHFYAYML